MHAAEAVVAVVRHARPDGDDAVGGVAGELVTDRELTTETVAEDEHRADCVLRACLHDCVGDIVDLVDRLTRFREITGLDVDRTEHVVLAWWLLNRSEAHDQKGRATDD